MARQTSAQRSVAGQQTPQTPGIAQRGAGVRSAGATGVYRLWFPARLGPARKRYRRVNGEEVRERVRTPELPPTKNTRDGSVYSQRRWVASWRAEAWAKAKAAGIPPCQRIRLSAVIYRQRLGIADVENDHARLAPLQDGLVDAGVVPKDTYRYVERGGVTEERAGLDGPGVLLIVDVIEPAAAAQPDQARGEE